MTLIEYKKIFLKSLSALYTPEEAYSIFKILIQERLGLDAAEIILSHSQKLTEPLFTSLTNDLTRLTNGEPIQYVTGKTLFYQLPFFLNNKVLIPRPETEELVQWIIDYAKSSSDKPLKVLDIGTGSGCISISLKKNIPNSQLTAMDISEAALGLAQKNAIINKTIINFIQLDVLNTHKLPEKYHIIVSNPPYVSEREKKQMHTNVLNHEPDIALFVKNSNPLVFYDKIGDLAWKYLHPNGVLFFEINQYLSQETKILLKNKGFSAIVIKKDFLGNDRLIRAVKKV